MSAATLPDTTQWYFNHGTSPASARNHCDTTNWSAYDSASCVLLTKSKRTGQNRVQLSSTYIVDLAAHLQLNNQTGFLRAVVYEGQPHIDLQNLACRAAIYNKRGFFPSHSATAPPVFKFGSSATPSATTSAPLPLPVPVASASIAAPSTPIVVASPFNPHNKPLDLHGFGSLFGTGTMMRGDYEDKMMLDVAANVLLRHCLEREVSETKNARAGDEGESWEMARKNDVDLETTEAMEVLALLNARKAPGSPDGTPPVVSRYQMLRVIRCIDPEQRELFGVVRKSVKRSSGLPGGNEHLLFHGTSAENASRIANGGGFNRSFSQRAVLGKGVYFSGSLDYSCNPTYAKPDSEGNQTILLARVLVGVPGLGESSLLEPPIRLHAGPRAGLRFDSVCNSSSYCTTVIGGGSGNPTERPPVVAVFRDGQALLEYIVTFKTQRGGDCGTPARVPTQLSSKASSGTYKPIEYSEKSGPNPNCLMAIVAMSAYRDKSPEELRLEYYEANQMDSDDEL